MNRNRSLLAALALLLLCCTGCSRVTFGYNHADWILRYWINGYTSFNAQQQREIHLEVESYMRWHRQQALPGYIAFLQQVQAAVERDAALDTTDVMRTRSELVRLYQMTMTPFVRPAAHVLSTLDREQTEELRKRLADRNREEREETLFGSEHKVLALRADRHIRFVEGLVGHLTHEQETAVREMSLRLPFITAYYIEQREARQARLLSLLDGHAGEDAIAALFRQWIEAPGSARSAQQQQAFDAHERAVDEMVVRTFALLLPHQKEHLRRRIAGHIRDLQQLHSATGTERAAYPPQR